MESTPDPTNTNTTKNKTSVSETGHAKNVANFLILSAFVYGFGNRYNPTKAVLKHSNLLLIHGAAKQAVKAVVDAKTPYKTVVNKRADEFADVSEYATQLINALESSDATERTIADAKAFLRKIRGERASKKKKPTEGEPTQVTHSSSQTSFDQVIQHMEGIESILKNEPSYAPNEDELRISAVGEKIARLHAANDAVAKVMEAISNARLNRDKILYNNPDALTTVAGSVKIYTKSVFKASSPEFKQISGITFKTYKKD
jgi:hypothetical protein